MLDPEKSNGKWRLFKALGYERENAAELEHDLKAGLAENGGEESIKNGKGEKTYAVDMELGRTSKAQIRTIWQVDEEGADPRFITAYKAKKRRDA